MKSLLLIAALFLAGLANAENVLVVKVEPELQTRIEALAHTLSTQGSDAVADSIEQDLQNPKMLAYWQNFIQSSDLHVVDVVVHPNEMKAVEWINLRFKRMGIPNLNFNAKVNENIEDPTALPEEKVKGKKWLRYLAGPGVAMAATIYGLPDSSNMATTDYIYLVVPAVGVGVTTVALELQFAWPWLNNIFWKKVWKFGGRIMGRVTNVAVNFLYGMSLYGAGVGAANIPVLFGGTPIPFETMSFTTAVTTAFIGGLTFHMAMGQYQTDISLEEERGAISGVNRYGLETTGVVVNNGARVFDWIIPGQWGAYAQGGFFLLKTFPQLLKTNVTEVIRDRNIHRTLNPETAPKKNIAEKCASLLGQFSLINLPKMRK